MTDQITLKQWPSVTFATGITANQSTVYDVIDVPDMDYCYVVLQESCFHPRDFRWPDQPADRGKLQWGTNQEHSADVLDVVKMMRAPSIEDLFDTAIQFTKRDMPVEARLLAALKLPRRHLSEFQTLQAKNQTVDSVVDESYRFSLSVGHSLGHLASYALNEVMKDHWRKPVQLDSRGYPDFIALSQIDSKVYEFGTLDLYRVGKSFRKLGCNVADAVAELPELTYRAKGLLEEWLRIGPKVCIETDGSALDQSRRWQCQLGDEQFWMFCGGTHLFHFDQIKSIQLQLNYDVDAKSIAMDISATTKTSF